MGVTHLPLLHFNDVYRVTKQKLQSGETIDATQFAARVDALRAKWPTDSGEDGAGSGGGLLLFSGDLFSPSVESSVTRGSHMVPVINMIAPDIALTGNHDFDFGYPHLLKLIAECHFPWILSNIIDTRTNATPAGLETFRVFERAGIRIGVIGLVEQNWLSTVPAWPREFIYKDMAQTGLELSRRLRGEEFGCELVLALTHCRVPNDIALARALSSYPSSSSSHPDIANQHGVDIIFGGHDHTYYIGHGAASWEGYERVEGEIGTEEDDGVLLVKSGTDFRDLSEMTLELEDAPPGSVRKRVVKALRGKRHQTTPTDPSLKPMADLIASVLGEVSSSMSAPVCETLEEWDVRSEVVRTDESSFGNWIADVIRHAYDDAIFDLGDHKGGADAVILCGGALRGDSRYGPGKITIGDVLEILPFSDAILVIEMDGKSIWDTLESSLSMWPAQEGRFPVISGLRVEWDSRRPPLSRILGLWLTPPDPKAAIRSHPGLPPDEAVKGEPIPREAGGKQYKIVTREYMYEGHDGFEGLVGKRCLIDDETGMIMSSIVRKFLLGSQYIHKMKQLRTADVLQRHLNDRETVLAIARAREKWKRDNPNRPDSSDTPAEPTSPISPARIHWLEATDRVLRASQEHCRAVIVEALRVCAAEHMSEVDGVDGQGVRRSKFSKKASGEGKKAPVRAQEDDLVTVRPVLDGRLKDIARPRKKT